MAPSGRHGDGCVIFPIIGAKDSIEQQGFLVNECPTCHRSRTFSVYTTKRKLTLYLIPTVGVRSQRVMECMVCHGKWGIAEAQWDDVQTQLMTQDQLATWVSWQERRREAAPSPSQRKSPTLYQILQVDPAADPEIIDVAYRRLAMKHHPDHGGGEGAELAMRRLNAARDILRDPDKRADYDRSLGIVRIPDGLRADDV